MLFWQLEAEPWAAGGRRKGWWGEGVCGHWEGRILMARSPQERCKGDGKLAQQKEPGGHCQTDLSSFYLESALMPT